MSDQPFILDRLDAAATLPLGKCRFAVPESRPIPANAVLQPIPRLLILLSGSKRVRLPLPEGRRDLQLQTGDVVYCLPDSWEMQDWRGHYQLLCIVPRKDYLRVSCYTQASASNAVCPMARFHHTGLPYQEVLRSTVNAMNAAVHVGAQPVIHGLARAMVGLAAQECQRDPSAVEGRPEQLYQRLRNWLDHSFQEEVNRELVARVFMISTGYVSQLFQHYGTCSFQDYLTSCRMQHARDLLEQTDHTIYQIADLCGFGNYVHFVRRFRQQHNLTPGQYRQQARQSTDARSQS